MATPVATTQIPIPRATSLTFTIDLKATLVRCSRQVCSIERTWTWHSDVLLG